MAGNSQVPGRSVISKVSAIVLAVTEASAPTLTEIATRSGLPLSTVHRLTNELLARSLLERDEHGRFRGGSPLRALGRRVPPPPTLSRRLVRERFAPVMEDLFRVTGAHARAGFLAGHAVAYAEKVCGHLPMTPLSDAARLPAHATALGKALLAFAPAATVDAIVVRGLTQYTSATITRPDRLKWVLRTVRTTRIAVCDRELDEQWCGMAAPVFGPGGAVVAALELRVRDPEQDAALVRALLTVAARSLSRELAAAHHGRTGEDRERTGSA